MGIRRTGNITCSIFSHGGWSNETTIMGTPDDPHDFKHIVDHAIEDGKIRPLIIVLPTYNNSSPSDSGSYSLALHLTANFHSELVNDPIPAVESKYSTCAESTDRKGLAASRDHRAFGGFSMGSMNTWYTFAHCLDYFRYFAPSSGGLIGSGAYMAEIVSCSGRSPDDFFIVSASRTEGFAYAGFKSGVLAMGGDGGGAEVLPPPGEAAGEAEGALRNSEENTQAAPRRGFPLRGAVLWLFVPVLLIRLHGFPLPLHGCGVLLLHHVQKLRNPAGGIALPAGGQRPGKFL